jgi:hypothetical protein
MNKNRRSEQLIRTIRFIDGKLLCAGGIAYNPALFSVRFWPSFNLYETIKFSLDFMQYHWPGEGGP